MSDLEQGALKSAVKTIDQAANLIGRLFVVAEPGAVFSEPVKAGDYTVITASEVTIGMGVGFGSGGGTDEEGKSEGAGGGGGGGGYSMGRPVATISVGPNGVMFQPIVDVTKLGIAFFTAVGAMFIAWRQMRKAAED